MNLDVRNHVASDVSAKKRNKAVLLTICLYALLFGVLISAGMAGVQGYLHYEEKVKTIYSCLEANQKRLMDASSKAIRQGRHNEIDRVLTIGKEKCNVSFIAINTASGDQIQVGSSDRDGNYIEQIYPLSFWQYGITEDYWKGQLVVRTSLKPIMAESIHLGFTQFVSYVLLTLLITFVVVALAYRIIVVRMKALVSYLKEGNLTSSDGNSSSSGGTEFSALWDGIKTLQSQLDGRLQEMQYKLDQVNQEKDKALKESEAKNLFLAKMSHELRTPMNGLLGFSTLLMETKLSDEQREYSSTIQASLESLLYVINDILDLSRIESGDLKITNMPFSLRNTISGVVSLLKKRAEAKSISFDTRVSPDIPQLLLGDPVRIRQILLNLVSNAIKYTDKGYVLVSVEGIKLEDGNMTVRMAIEDTGRGIMHPSQTIPNSGADTFANLSADTIGRRGVGLDVCYQIADLMDAKIEYESAVGEGTTFWLEVSLPVVKQTADQSSINLSLLKELNVLVIDSYALSRKITLELLEDWGVRFDAVTNAADAQTKLIETAGSGHEFNLVLCDDLLSDFSGIEAIKQIRSLAEIGDAGIVVLSSNPQLGDADSFHEAGANGFLSKEHRDPYLQSVMCQVYSERKHDDEYADRLVTRYTVSDYAGEELHDLEKEKETAGQVLVVEDNIVNQQLAIRMLEKKGFNVDVAANGFEAIELFKSNQYKLIFMDCLMPEMDGFEATQIIREIEQSQKWRAITPIIALTAHAVEGEAERCFQAGMDEFITKPFKVTHLDMVLDRYIN